MSDSRQVKSKQRVADHGEVFTDQREVRAMCDLVQSETERIDSRFLEPACGTGNFLAEILSRKLAVVRDRFGGDSMTYRCQTVLAVSSLYGVELLKDNAAECRERLYGLWASSVSDAGGSPDDDAPVIRYLLSKNILCGDALTMRRADGSPITFAEWTMSDDGMVVRRDYQLADLLAQDGDESNGQLTIGAAAGYDSDGETEPIRVWPPVHWSGLPSQEEGVD